MSLFTFLLMALVACTALNRFLQRQRVAWLAQRLAVCPIESSIQTLMEGYHRALGEADPERQTMVWRHLASTEEQLARQLRQLSAQLREEPETQTRISRLPIALPFATAWLPQATFDLREAFAAHAQGFQSVVDNAQQLPARRRAYTLLAEMLLIQHTCHWFCRSKAVASARLRARHQTAYEQVLHAVSETTRSAYLALVQA